MTTAFKNRLDYIQHTFAPESDALRDVRESLTDPNDQIYLSPQEGKLLQVLITMAGVRKIVEIGTLGGYSALWMAAALPAGGQIFTLEKDPARAVRAAGHFARFDADKKITLKTGDALQTLPQLENDGPFDMVFIDADKLNYMNYLNWAEKNVRKGGLIVGDNTFLFDSVWRGAPADNVRKTAFDAMQNFNKRLGDANLYRGILLPTEEGMTVAVKLF
ncbi:MAG: O-methyltransferase [Micavibrio sp.]|nr:O-methyltransferase [Micavibrio sp.]